MGSSGRDIISEGCLPYLDNPTSKTSLISYRSSNSEDRYFITLYNTRTLYDQGGNPALALDTTGTSIDYHYEIVYAIYEEIQDNSYFPFSYYAKILGIRIFYNDLVAGNTQTTPSFILDIKDIATNIRIQGLYDRLTMTRTSKVADNFATLLDVAYTNNFEPNVYVKEIGVKAFANVSSLYEVIFDNNIRYIAPLAFKSCTNLSRIILPSSYNLNIDRSAFINNTSLQTVIIPKNVSVISAECFALNTSLRFIDMPYVTRIEYNAFFNANLDTIYISPFLKEIEKSAFSSNSNNNLVVFFNKDIYDGSNNPLGLVDYDISINDISPDAFIMTKQTNILVVNLPVGSAWETYFNGLIPHLYSTYTRDVDDISSIRLPDNVFIKCNSSDAEIYDVDTETLYYTFDYTDTNIRFVIGTRTYAIRIYNNTGGGSFYDLNDGSLWSDSVSSTFAWTINGRTEYINYWSKLQAGSDLDGFISVAPYNVRNNNSYYSYYLEILKPFAYDLVFNHDTNKLINFRYSHSIPQQKIIPLSQSTLNAIAYSHDYVVVDTSYDIYNNINSVNNMENHINTDIYFGISPFLPSSGSVTYNIDLIQDFDTARTRANPDIYSGYVENRYSDASAIYTGNNGITSRYYFESGMLAPILSWNGGFNIELPEINLTQNTLTLGGITIDNLVDSTEWDDASSVILKLNNATNICHFVYSPVGHLSDSGPPLIYSLNDLIEGTTTVTSKTADADPRLKVPPRLKV